MILRLHYGLFPLFGILFLVLAVSLSGCAPENTEGTASLALRPIPEAQPRNVIFILTDDHRFDAMGFHENAPPWLETPHLDRMAAEGAFFRNAFVTTSLCSPSRASILTGQYAHRHGVVDNAHLVPEGTIFFPQYLQQIGYETAFVGKWHMGLDTDEPRPGFDHWVSFKGQGTYYPNADGLNVNGKHVPQKGYITDELTDYAIDWLNNRSADKPFFLYLSHKAVHSHHDILIRGENGEALLMTSTVIPAKRHENSYADEQFVPPPTMTDTPESRVGKPMWAINQRNSWHGTTFQFHQDFDLEQYYRQYMETLRGVDDSVGRVFDYLRENGLLESTLVIYMGDNGYVFGEQGHTDKRTAYETSIRIPMLAHCPEIFPAGTKIDEVVANIDIAPTILETAGLEAPNHMDGRSFLPLLRGETVDWRDYLLYEYFWERYAPHTPTMHAVRGERFKYVRPYGVWDLDELYDLQADPLETHNLALDPAYEDTLRGLNRQLFEILEATGGMQIQLQPDPWYRSLLRRRSGSPQASFPEAWMRDKDAIQ